MWRTFFVTNYWVPNCIFLFLGKLCAARFFPLIVHGQKAKAISSREGRPSCLFSLYPKHGCRRRKKKRRNGGSEIGLEREREEEGLLPTFSFLWLCVNAAHDLCSLLFLQRKKINQTFSIQKRNPARAENSHKEGDDSIVKHWVNCVLFFPFMLITSLHLFSSRSLSLLQPCRKGGAGVNTDFSRPNTRAAQHSSSRTLTRSTKKKKLSWPFKSRDFFSSRAATRNKEGQYSIFSLSLQRYQKKGLRILIWQSECACFVPSRLRAPKPLEID